MSRWMFQRALSKPLGERIEREIDGVTVTPRVMDYTHGDGSRLHLGPVDCRERTAGGVHRIEHRQL